ncbi:MAG TPA: class 1 fructose-bisphosphatase [Amaricoccus sp.]|nr:class 1 fructose-bisphosphatase [Amaricoccus sp.]
MVSTLPDLAVPQQYRTVVGRIAAVAADLARTIAGGTGLEAAIGENADGDRQTRLDLIADDAFRTVLAGAGVRFYASEEQELAIELDAAGALAVAIDPLDGSSNIAVNVPIGTIFAIHHAAETAEATFFRPGRALAGAGYVIYGPRCYLVTSFGEGVQMHQLDPASGRFRLVEPRVALPLKSAEFAINASNYRHWDPAIRAYVDDCVAGTEGPRERDFNMRWIASLVAEAHRILTRGGIFLYPRDGRKGYERGRLRLVYEGAPIAFLIEQAGGKATDGIDAILDRAPASLHERTPFVFGSAQNVARVASYHDLPEGETSALFGRRGLFRGRA